MIEVLSLFTGAGGLDLGLESSGFFKVTARVEAEEQYCKTISDSQTRNLLGDARIFQSDYRKIHPKQVWTQRQSAVRGIVAGPPCESYSSFGLQQGRRDPRGELIFELIDWIDKSLADFFIIENVPFLTQGRNQSIFKELLAEFSSRGFAVDFRILNAADYGAATSRRRVIVLGLRGKTPLAFPRPTHADPLSVKELLPTRPWVTSGDALRGLPTPTNCAPSTPSGHVRIAHTAPVTERFAALAPGQYDRVRRRSRLAWDRPSPSLVAGNLTGTRAHIHPIEPRELTNRECARIQGFPDAFDFAGSRSAVAKQIANAVPVALARQIAEAVGQQLASGRRHKSGRTVPKANGKSAVAV